ncbi:MAG TPA: S8 family serine peptidase [Pyrinomonadaceae bacterium]|nr:S8 family serine peptidase [Pyrinomonadaceae bacterium]
MKRIALATCVAALLTLVLTTGNTFTGVKAQKNQYRPFQRPGDQFVPSRVLVKFNSDVMPDHGRNIIAALGARDAAEMPALGVFVLDLPEQADETAFAHAMQSRPEVEYAEVDRILPPEDMNPNDPWYVDQWHLRKISGPTAWSSTTGSSNVIIAILDTGVDGTHPDLASKMVPGWNIYNNNSDTSDMGGHGTAVAGTAAASSNNGDGVASVAWGCKIMPIRVTDSTGYATFSALASGLQWAADHGARVANLSFNASDSSTVKSAAQYFQNKGGVVAVAAGNQATFTSAADNPYVLTVGSTDANDLLASFSNTGNNVDISSPGTNIRTTAKGGGYVSTAGTSVSAPLVAGVAALVMSINPNLTPTQIQNVLKQSADDLGSSGWDTSYGWGRLNAARAMALAGGGTVDTTPPTTSITSPAASAAVSGSVTVSVSATDNVSVTSVALSIDGVVRGTDSSSPCAFLWDTTTVSNGLHTLTASASDAAGNSASYSITVMVSNSAPPLDTTPPTETITSPSDGTTLPTNASIYVNALDNVGVVRNELYVDGALVSSSTSAPFTTKWNTRKVKAGPHVLQCKAYDAAGNVGLSQLVNVNK